ncbi:STARD3 N-terminal-like protein, partial [Simochromis diagramma]|uniref:STARD3 N-terminal-like protein n=1 Tax=Simochromis diagramma TaxID=43689 RepID=UPI001A7EC92A
VNGGIQNRLEQEVLHYDYHASFFDIFLLAVFRFAVLILAYAVCKLRHWWAIAITTAVSCAFLIAKVILSRQEKLLSQGAFGYLLPIISFVLAWIETWLLDFKVLPQEIEDENRHQSIIDTSRAPLLGPGPLSDWQFYSPPESLQVCFLPLTSDKPKHTRHTRFSCRSFRLLSLMILTLHSHLNERTDTKYEDIQFILL